MVVKDGTYKIIRRQRVASGRVGKVKYVTKGLEPHEISTINCLARFGFDIETIAPSNIPKTHSPDILMLGTFWEMKGLKTANEKTIKAKFRKAVKQSDGKAIFDIREFKKDKEEVKTVILKLFSEIRKMRRIIVLENDEFLLDIFKKKR